MRNVFRGAVVLAVVAAGIPFSAFAQSGSVRARPAAGAVRTAPTPLSPATAVNPGPRTPRLAPALSAPARAPAAVPYVELQGGPQEVLAPWAVDALSAALAPELKILAEPGSDGGHASARRVEDVITRRESIPAAALGGGALALAAGPSLERSAPAPTAPSERVPAAAGTLRVPKVAGRLSYALRRRALSAIARLTGAVFTLPNMSPSLEARVLERAGDTLAIISDLDHTLAPYAKPMPAETAAALGAVLDAGKTVVLISERPALPTGGSETSVQESLSSLPPQQRAGLIIAGRKDGVIASLDFEGRAAVLDRVEGFTPSERRAIELAAAYMKEHVRGFGAELHDGSGGIPTEEPGSHAYALMLKPGTSEETVASLARVFQQTLEWKGLNYRVEGRVARDSRVPPYLTFAKSDKTVLTRRIAELEDIKPEEALILGDAMLPASRPGPGWFSRLLQRLGERLAGTAPRRTGNSTDRDMEAALPGALTLAVGGSADPRMSNAFVTAARGPEASAQVLRAAARAGRAGLEERRTALDIAAVARKSLSLPAPLMHVLGSVAAIGTMVGLSYAAASALSITLLGGALLVGLPAFLIGMAAWSSAYSRHKGLKVLYNPGREILGQVLVVGALAALALGVITAYAAASAALGRVLGF